MSSPSASRNLKRISLLSKKSSESLQLHSNLLLRNADHHNFHDIVLIAKQIALWLGMIKGKDPVAMLNAVNQTTLSFLNVCNNVSDGKEREREMEDVCGSSFKEYIVPISTFLSNELHSYEDEFFKYEDKKRM